MFKKEFEIKILIAVVYVIGGIAFFKYSNIIGITIISSAFLLHIIWIDMKLGLSKRLTPLFKFLSIVLSLLGLSGIWFWWSKIEARDLVYYIVKANPEHFTPAIEAISYFYLLKHVITIVSWILMIPTALYVVVSLLLYVAVFFKPAIEQNLVIKKYFDCTKKIFFHLLLLFIGSIATNYLLTNYISKKIDEQFNVSAHDLIVKSSYVDNVKLNYKQERICTNKDINENAKIAFLDDGYVSVAIPESNSTGFMFSKRFCETNRERWIQPKYEIKTMKCNPELNSTK